MSKKHIVHFQVNVSNAPTPVANIIIGEKNKISNVSIDANKMSLLILVGVLATLLIVGATTYIFSKGKINLLKELGDFFARIIEVV